MGDGVGEGVGIGVGERVGIGVRVDVGVGEDILVGTTVGIAVGFVITAWLAEGFDVIAAMLLDAVQTHIHSSSTTVNMPQPIPPWVSFD